MLITTELMIADMILKFRQNFKVTERWECTVQKFLICCNVSIKLINGFYIRCLKRALLYHIIFLLKFTFLNRRLAWSILCTAYSRAITNSKDANQSNRDKANGLMLMKNAAFLIVYNLIILFFKSYKLYEIVKNLVTVKYA